MYEIGDGRGATTLRVYDISSAPATNADGDENRILHEQLISYVFPLGCSFFDNGRLCVMTDGAALLLDENFEERERYDYSGEISAVSTTKDGAAIALKSGNMSGVCRVIAFDKNGDMLYNEIVAENALDIGVCEKYIFMRTNIGVVRVDCEDGSRQTLECQSGKMLVYDASTAIVCGESKAVYTKFGDVKE